ncbi:MAG: hypothetical protein ACREFO_02980 [Acetobacteraceae bacterium]
MHAIMIGLDIAKSVFQVHVADCTGQVLQQKKLRRSQVEAFFARHPERALRRVMTHDGRRDRGNGNPT